MTSSDNYAVLVTGGAGFLGQHMIGLLQSHAPYVQEIRVLDMKPYENKLDYKCSVEIKQFIGSINDRNLAWEACQGVAAVFHLASVVDVSMFPDTRKMELVNVEGTAMLLEVCKEAGVKRFIYCSSMAVVLGHSHINGGTELTTSCPKSPMHNGYAITKRKAETLVIESNSSSLKTISLRPVTFYGEEDVSSLALTLKLASKFGRWTLFDCKDAIHQMAYAGNIAWEFICAEKAMLKDTDNITGGNIFFAVDDTPLADVYEIAAPFASACNFPVSRHKLPMWLALYPFYILYFVLWVISFFVSVNIEVGVPGLELSLFSYNFKYDKAKTLLGYTPLYTYEESFKRSLRFYKRYAKL